MSETPMMAQYRQFKAQYPDAILMFRLGDFYEMFFADAEVAARELELVLTGRDAGKDLGRVPMCGIPHHAVEGYLARLIEKGFKVAVCEQMEDPRTAKGLVKRDVIRVVTPGTLVEPRLLPEKRNRYLAAVCQGKAGFGLAIADLSTGEFACCELLGAEGGRVLLDELGRLDPAEVLLEPGLAAEERWLAALHLHTAAAVSNGSAREFQPATARRVLCEHFGLASLHGFGCEDKPLAMAAAGAALAYLAETQKTSLGHISGLSVYYPGDFLVLDAATRRNLELTAPLMAGGRRGTLLGVLDRTVTAMGGRLLRRWVEQPLLRLNEIHDRQSAVGALVAGALLRADLRDLLGRVHDLERLAGRVAYGTANARDLQALAVSLGQVPGLAHLLGGAGSGHLAALAAALDPCDDLRELLDRAIAPEPPASLTEGGLLREGYDAEVDRLRRAGREGKDWIAALEGRERERTGIRSLKVGFNKVFGYFIEVTTPNLPQVPTEYIRKQTIANGERFLTPELKEMESEILGAEEKLVALEYQLFTAIRGQVAAHVARVQGVARAVAELDALASLAEVAVAGGYCCPEIDAGESLQISDGRHPVLERLLPAGTFVPNDTLLDTGEHRLLLITGPNMGGKSTYMRQVALITLMAQMGSWVPARAARVGVVDRIFTRVGASDDLATGQSTFMVEMAETASILHGATSRSLILLDEVGRGTATFDGLSLAWAIAEHIHRDIGAKTLFATHYHELCELEGLLPGVQNYSVAVREQGDEVIFLHRIAKGGADRSYGIHVAQLAGLPAGVIERAREILAGLDADEAKRREQRREAVQRVRQRPATQLTFLEQKRHPVLDELLGLNVMALTPIDALNLLYKLQEKARER